MVVACVLRRDPAEIFVYQLPLLMYVADKSETASRQVPAGQSDARYDSRNALRPRHSARAARAARAAQAAQEEENERQICFIICKISSGRPPPFSSSFYINLFLPRLRKVSLGWSERCINRTFDAIKMPL